jgi:hypothetical protein
VRACVRHQNTLNTHSKTTGDEIQANHRQGNMSNPLSIAPPTAFSPHGDISSVSDRWSSWLRRFETYTVASGVKDDKQKRALLLHCAGEEVQTVFETLPNTGDKYDDAKQKLTEHFKPLANVTFQRHLFRKEAQKDGETVSQFVVRLRRLAESCSFGDSKDDFIRDQVVDKCASKSLRRKLLAEKELTLTKVLELAQAKEASEFQAAQIAETESSFAVQAPTAQKPSDSHMTKHGKHKHAKTHGQNSQHVVTGTEHRIPQCSRCGQKGHTGHECRCTKGKTCYKCNRVGHFASMCRSQKTRANFVEGASAADNVDVPSTSSTDSAVSGCDCPDCAYTVDIHTGHGLTKFAIADTPIHMMIDSGASCNILNAHDAATLQKKGVQTKPCNRIIHPYMSPPLKVANCISAPIRYQQSEITAEFLVLDGSHPSLLGKTTSQQLGVLHVVNQVDSAPNPLTRYPGIARGVGKLKHQTVKIHVDRSVPPVARKHSRVPFHLRDKV